MKQLLYFAALALSLSACSFGSLPGGGGQQYPSGGGRQSPSSGGDDTYGGSSGNQQPQPRTGPYGRAADPGVQVTNIRLTRDYTILNVRFTDRSQVQYDRNGRQISGNTTISFDPSGRLVAANGAREFRFVRVEGIPMKPQNRSTRPGDVVDFVLYFERLDKGLETFDLFECNDYDQIVCWNIYNLYVSNPADAVYTPTAPPPTTRPTQTPPQPSGNSGGEVATAPPPPPAPVSNVLTVTGTVQDAKTKRPLTATIDYRLSSSKQAVDSVQSFASTGGYRMTLLRGQVYTYVASAKGYLVANGVLDLSKATVNQKITRDIFLTPLSVGDKITLQNIYFELSKSDLLPASYTELDKLVTMMQDNPKMQIRLEGHTDIIGDHDKNLTLSKDRVLACQSYIVRKGIDMARIQTVGYGDTRPIKTTGTDEERKVNRRVEFVILTL